MNEPFLLPQPNEKPENPQESLPAKPIDEDKLPPVMLKRVDNRSQKMVRSGKLSPKAALFFQKYFRNGFCGWEAATKVFNCKDRYTAAKVASYILKKHPVEKQTLLEMAGLTPGKLFRKIDEGLESTNFNYHLGKFLPDFRTRHQYLRLAGEWMGLAETKPTDSDRPSVHNQYNIFNIDSQKAQDFNAKFREFLSSDQNRSANENTPAQDVTNPA